MSRTFFSLPVCIQRGDDRGVFETLPGHEGLVTCVFFLRDDLFFSGDDKGQLRCWRNIGSQARLPHVNLVNSSNDIFALFGQWTSTCHIQAHQKAISSLCVHEHCLATGSSDALVKIWKFTSNEGSGKGVYEICRSWC